MRTYIVTLLAAAAIACGHRATPTAPSAATPATAADLKSLLSASFDAFPIPIGSTCSITISQYGQVILERGRGQSFGRAADGDTLYRIASLTKPITAAAVLINEKAGRLNRNDKINRYVAFPEPAPTLDELIKHVPGLFNYLETSEYQIGRTSPTTVENILSLIKPWDGIPRFEYSNSHAILSGAALQRVNGMRYEDVVQRDIFGPAGMSRSSFGLPPDAASLFLVTHPTWVYSAGGITSTTADLNRFNQALLNNAFGIGAVESFDRSANGVTSFAMGSRVIGADLRFTHVGSLDNYGSITVMFPADRSSIVLLCNFNNGDIQGQGNFMTNLRNIMLTAK